MITIRPATITDIPGLLPLITNLGYPATKEELERRFANFVQNDGYGVAVASSDTHLIGWVSWSKSHLFVLDKVRFHIEGLIVDSNYRSQGVGKKLMLFIEEGGKNLQPRYYRFNLRFET